MTYKNITGQFHSGIHYEITTDEGLEGIIIIIEIAQEEIKANPHLIDMLDAYTRIKYHEGEYVQKSRLSKGLLIYQEADAIQMLIEVNISAHNRAIHISK